MQFSNEYFCTGQIYRVQEIPLLKTEGIARKCTESHNGQGSPVALQCLWENPKWRRQKKVYINIFIRMLIG